MANKIIPSKYIIKLRWMSCHASIDGNTTDHGTFVILPTNSPLIKFAMEKKIPIEPRYHPKKLVIVFFFRK